MTGSETVSWEPGRAVRVGVLRSGPFPFRYSKWYVVPSPPMARSPWRLAVDRVTSLAVPVIPATHTGVVESAIAASPFISHAIELKAVGFQAA